MRTYGPLPAPTESGELNQRSALSVLAAPGLSVPPCCLTSFEFTTPRDVFARIAGIAVFEVFERSTTPYLPAALVVTPASRNDGLPLRLTSRLNENTTSADVRGVPSAKWTFRLSWNVYVFASSVTRHDWTRSGIGWATSEPRYVNSVSKIPRFTSEAVGSNALCGSEVLISNERSITSVSPAAFALVPAYAAAAAAANTTTRTSPIHPPRRMADPVMRFLLCVWA